MSLTSYRAAPPRDNPMLDPTGAGPSFGPSSCFARRAARRCERYVTRHCAVGKGSEQEFRTIVTRVHLIGRTREIGLAAGVPGDRRGTPPPHSRLLRAIWRVTSTGTR